MAGDRGEPIVQFRQVGSYLDSPKATIGFPPPERKLGIDAISAQRPSSSRDRWGAVFGAFRSY